MLYILSAIVCIVAGILAWNWMEPEGFGQVLVFLFVWLLFTTLGYWILEIIYKAIHSDEQ